MQEEHAMPRNLTLIIHWFFDQLLPPFLRDSRWLMGLVFRLALGSKYHYYLDFKDRLPELSEQEIQGYYTRLADTFIQRKTDLNTASIKAVLNASLGNSLLDVACGSGWLSHQLAAKGFAVIGGDIMPPVAKGANPVFSSVDVTQLPFADQQFDTVVCAHTLEHVQDIQQALAELRRVCKHRLIIVLPCQREYRYTFDLHIHFFPYEYKVRQLLGSQAAVQRCGGDFVIIEDQTNEQQP